MAWALASQVTLNSAGARYRPVRGVCVAGDVLASFGIGLLPCFRLPSLKE